MMFFPVSKTAPPKQIPGYAPERVAGSLVELPLWQADGHCRVFFEKAPLPVADLENFGGGG